MIVPHREADDVAMRSAAEAMEKLLFVIDVEAGSLFLVKGATAFVFAPRADKPHPLADDFGKRQAQAQLVKKGGRKAHGEPF